MNEKMTDVAIKMLPKASIFLEYSAIMGLIVTTVLIININNKAFNYVFKENSKRFFWLFMILSTIPLLIFIYLFTVLFGRFGRI
jgi:apolipoprotein N-acyltransferase